MNKRTTAHNINVNVTLCAYEMSENIISQIRMKMTSKIQKTIVIWICNINLSF
jgi:hypothetical protein